MNEKNQKNQPAPPQDTKTAKVPTDDIFLKPPSFKNPALMFLFIMIPVLLGIFYNFMAAIAPRPAPPVPVEIQKPVNPVSQNIQGMMPRTRGRETPHHQTVTGVCDDLQELVGMKADEREVALKVRETGEPYRLLPPGSSKTMDQNPQRINLDLDDQGAIVRVWCG